MNKQNSLRDVSNLLEEATEMLGEIELRAIRDNPPALTFEQRIIKAAKGIDAGDTLKDFLTCTEVEHAIITLANIYNTVGIKMPVDWY